MEKILRKPIKVVCMGDSITEGYGLGDDPGMFYPRRLQKFLGRGYEVFNQGVSGCCVTNTANEAGETVGSPYALQAKYREALGLAGDIYILLLGTNDAQDGMSDDLSYQDQLNNVIAYEKQFIHYYQQILDAVKKANPNAKIFICRPAPVLECIWPKHSQKHLDILLPYYDEILKRNPQCVLIDIFMAFKNSEGPLENYYQPDGLHPNGNGAELIAESVFGAIRKYGVAAG